MHAVYRCVRALKMAELTTQTRSPVTSVRKQLRPATD
jgi:hypothetical protein